MAKSLIFGLDLARQTQIWASNFFIYYVILFYFIIIIIIIIVILQIFPLLVPRHCSSYHPIKFTRNVNQTQENDEKPNFRSDFGPKTSFVGFFDYQMQTFFFYHSIRFQGKFQNSRHTFLLLLLNLYFSVTRHHGQLSSFTI